MLSAVFPAGWTFPALAGGLRPVVAQNPEILTESRGYAIDILIVLVLFGAALFVICRSSRRV